MRATHGAGNVQHIPAAVGGDGGIDAVVRSRGIVYQFYAPEPYATARELYERQRDKLTDDIGKFIANRSRIQKILGDTKASRWILLTPFLRHSELVAHAAAKTVEVRKAKLPYVKSADFEVIIETDAIHGTTAAVPGIAGDRRFEDPWGRLAFDSKLWPVDTDETAPDLRAATARLASVCWHFVTGLSPEVRSPWQDVKHGNDPQDVLDLAYRTVRLAERFVADTRLQLGLSAYEAAVLLAAPFLREAALATGEARVYTQGDPFHIAAPARLGAGETSWLRHALEATFAKRPQLERKARRLEGSADRAAFHAVVWWLIQRTVAALPETWEMEQPGRRGLFPPELADAMADLLRTLPRVGEARPLDPIRMARCLSADPDAFDEPATAILREVPWDRPSGGQIMLRPSLIARLLGLVGLLASDPRRLSEIVIDHLGLTEPTDAETSVHFCRTAVWEGTPTAWILKLSDIRHPAYDLAFEQLVGDAVRYANLLLADVRRNPAGISELMNLPSFRAELAASRDGRGEAAYVRPHVRFELATDEIKEILMGSRLYGDPMVAVRELYQNALDACRYREARIKAWAAREALAAGGDGAAARRRYDELRGRYLAAWKGLAPAGPQSNGAAARALIRFDQRLIDGRLVVECSDDGVGMGRRELEQCFARAGRRFSETDEFSQERALWRDISDQLGLGDLPPDAPEQIDFTPNSQFGIGVFSYFMLADEIEVQTRRVHYDERGERLGETLRVRISSSGSLFRTTLLPEQGQPPGTSIRLILGESHCERPRSEWSDDRVREPVSVLDAMREFLWVAEFETQVSGGDGSIERWEVDQLHQPVPSRYSRLGHRAAWMPIARGEAWWDVSGNLGRGALLADGVITDSDGPKGLLLNLRRSRRPTLTVDRKKVVDRYSAHWANETLERCAVSDLFPREVLGAREE